MSIKEITELVERLWLPKGRQEVEDVLGKGIADKMSDEQIKKTLRIFAEAEENGSLED